jgi:adenylate cyclase
MHSWLSGITERRLVLIIALFLCLPLLKPGCSSSMEDMTLRAATRFAESGAAGANIEIIALDERTFNTYGPWPGPAGALAQGIEKLTTMKPGLIVVDESSDRGRFDLAPVLPKLKGDERAIIGYTFYRNLSDLPSDYAQQTGGKTPAEAEALALPASPRNDYALPSMAGIAQSTLKATDRRDADDGFSNVFEDADGVVRSQPMLVRLEHRAYPALALAALAAIKGFTPTIAQSPTGKLKGISLGETTLRTSAESRTGIAFNGPAGTVPRVSLIDVVAGNIKPEDVVGKILLVGYTDKDAALMLDTPFGIMPHVEILANTLAGMLDGRSVMLFTDAAWSAAIALLAVLIYAFGIMRARLRARFAWTLGIVFIVWIAAIIAYAATSILIPAMQLTLFFAVFLIISAAWKLFVIEIPRRFRLKTFAMRISPEELERAFRKPGAIVARGITRDIVAIAFDIRGFAAIAGSHKQDELCTLMREYRTILARILLKHGAFIDSWAGDECRAAFGAMMPGSGHELDACRAAIDAVKTFARMKADVTRRYGVERIRLGVGIAAGTAGVGNLGPRGVSDLGITGEALERALTLRALTKTYRSSVIVDGAICEAVENSFTFRALDPILVPGQNRIVHVHELLGRTGIILPHLGKYLEAREAYLRGEFETAVHLFSLILAEHPNDGASLVLLKRARMLAKTPPNADWRGVWGTPEVKGER